MMVISSSKKKPVIGRKLEQIVSKLAPDAVVVTQDEKPVTDQADDKHKHERAPMLYGPYRQDK